MSFVHARGKRGSVRMLTVPPIKKAQESITTDNNGDTSSLPQDGDTKHWRSLQAAPQSICTLGSRIHSSASW